MKNTNILEKVKSDLEKLSRNPKNIKDYSRFHKDKKPRISIISSLIKKVSSENFKEVKNLDKKEILFLCEELLKTKKDECISIAFDWAFRMRKQYKIFESWLKRFVNDWGSCDNLCTRAFGQFIYKFSEFLPQIKKWVNSPNKWFRRASAVVLIYSLRRGKYLKEVFVMSKILLKDKEDLVQKGYGWALKEASKLHQKEVFDFVIKNKKEMSRTALRYSNEKMPKNLKERAMERGRE
jgi:3-methyladenine DNA glycosylase AlkD